MMGMMTDNQKSLGPNRLIKIFLVAMLPLWGGGCGQGTGHNHGHGHGHGHGDETPPEEVQLSAKAMKQHGIRVESVDKRVLKPTFSVPARVAFDEESIAHVGTLVNGRVTDMKVHIGDTVKEGDVLFVIESPELGTAQNAFLQALDAEQAAAPGVELAHNNAGVAKAMAEIESAKALMELAKNPAVINQSKAELVAAQAALILEQNDATVAQAEGRLAATEPVEKRARELVVAGQKLYEAKALARKELQRREAELATAIAEVAAAKAALTQAKAQQERDLKAAQANVAAKQAALTLTEAQQSKDMVAARAKMNIAAAMLKAANAGQAKELGEAQGILSMAQAGVAAARNKLSVLGMAPGSIDALAKNRKLNPQYSALAPRAGTVVEREVTQGESVSSDQPHLLMLADLSRVWVIMEAPPARADVFRKGIKVSLRSKTTGREISALLDFVNPTVDPETRTVRARVELDNTDGSWRPGQFLTSLVPTGAPATETLVVPVAAVQYVDGQPVVYQLLQKENTFKQVVITAGPLSEGWVAVTGGLEKNTKIVTHGSFLLKAEFGKAKAGHDHSH